MSDDDNSTAFDLKVKKNMLPWLIAFAVGGLGGTNLGAFGDLWRTREWKDSNIEAIEETKRLRLEIIALKAQQETLYNLLEDEICETTPY